MRPVAALLAIVAALSASGASFAAARTTEPSKYVLVTVLLMDQRVVIGAWQGTKHHGDLTPLAGPVPRGDYLSFNVLNRSKHVQQFTIFGKKTPAIKPGGKAHLFVTALVRGNFQYKSTVANGKVFRGYMTVA
jgi:hypothetical protein